VSNRVEEYVSTDLHHPITKAVNLSIGSYFKQGVAYKSN
jgi:hypothetical protein